MRLMVPQQLVALQSNSLMVEDTRSATGLLSLDTMLLDSKTIWRNLLNSWWVVDSSSSGELLASERHDCY